MFLDVMEIGFYPCRSTAGPMNKPKSAAPKITKPTVLSHKERPFKNAAQPPTANGMNERYTYNIFALSFTIIMQQSHNLLQLPRKS